MHDGPDDIGLSISEEYWLGVKQDGRAPYKTSNTTFISFRRCVLY